MKRLTMTLGCVCLVFSFIAGGFFAYGASGGLLHLVSAFWFLALGIFLIWRGRARSEST